MAKKAKTIEPVEALFRRRMIREGTLDRFNMIVKDFQCDGKDRDTARKLAMEEMGYEGPKVERALAVQWEEILDTAAPTDPYGVEEACAELPKNANPAAELDWVRIHPAIRRCAMEPDKTKQVVITDADVLHSQAGPAPSVGAVNMLIHAVNAPAKFFDSLLAEQRKRVDNEEGNKATRADLGIAEIRNYLSQLQSRNKGQA